MANNQLTGRLSPTLPSKRDQEIIPLQNYTRKTIYHLILTQTLITWVDGFRQLRVSAGCAGGPLGAEAEHMLMESQR